MSDPVSKVEIEDVLSSIRRLVSEERRVEPRRITTREPKEPDRLILVPAFRVESVPDEGAGATDDHAEDLSEGAAAPEILHPEEPWRDPEATLFGAADAAPEDEADEDPERAAGDEAVAEEVDAADGGSAGEFVGDASGLDEASGWDAKEAASEEPWEDEGDHADAAVMGEMGLPPETETAGDHDATPEDLDQRAETLSAKIEALEEAIGRTTDQWEPDGQGRDDYAGTPIEAIEWEDHNPGDKPDVFETTATIDGPDADDGHEDLAAEETILDEESLRELVADIVREELQGALGERITRNVRKLVRREIHRALAAQDLE